MEEILEAKINFCVEFKQTLINSLGYILWSLLSQIFWSFGFTPSDASTTRALFYPGQNHLGHIPERVKANLLLGNTKQKQVSIFMTLMMRHHRFRTMRQFVESLIIF